MAGYQRDPLNWLVNRPAIREITSAWDTTAVTGAGLAGWWALVVLLRWAFRGTAPTLAALLVATAAWGVAALLLLVLQAGLRQLPPGRPKHAVTVTGYAIAGWATHLGTTTLGAAMGLADPVPARVLVSGAVIWLTSLAMLANQHLRAGAALANLAAQRRELEQARAETTAALAETQQDLQEVIAQVHRAVRAARYRLSVITEPAEYLEVADGLAATVQFLVRPVSHSLAREANSLRDTELGATPDAVQQKADRPSRHWSSHLRQIRDDLGAANPFRPTAVAVNLIPVIIGAAYVVRFGAGRTGILIGLAVAYPILVLGAWAWRRWPPESRRGRWTFALGVYLAMVLGYLIGARAAAAGTPAQYLVGALMPAALALLTALSAALEHRRAESVAEVARLVEQSRWAAAAVQQQLWASQRQLGLAMHGRVQAGLTATAMVLRAWVRSGRDAEPEDRLRARVDATLDECLQAVEDPTTPQLGALLADLTDVWAGVLDIELDLDPTALARLDDDPSAAAAAGEILRELLLNAVHHGQAGNAQVRLLMHSRNILELAVRTPQTLPEAAGNAPGLGTELVASLSLGSEVQVGETTRTTKVLLAVGT